MQIELPFSKNSVQIGEDRSTIGLNQHTIGHVNCPACESVRATILQSLHADLTFEDAAKLFMELRQISGTPGSITARYVRKNTAKAYKRQSDSLELFFGAMPLREIHWWHMRAYQAARNAGDPPFHRFRRPQDAKPRVVNGVLMPPKGKTPCPAKPSQINQELQHLKRIMKLAGSWSDEDDRYFENLQEDESDVPRALTEEQQALWIDVSRCREKWNLVHWYSILAFDSCASSNELRGLRLGDVSIPQRAIRVPWAASKNPYRHRDIAIENADALWALERLIARAHDLGSRDPQHYLFPFRSGNEHWDVEKAATESFLKRSWQEVRDATGLAWFRTYDTRHTAATRLAEEGVPIDIILARMGHCSDRMRRHYTHISLQAQRRWLRRPPARESSFSEWPSAIDKTGTFRR